MGRSLVLSGRLNQRDRAQLRGKLDGAKQKQEPSPQDELLAWLQNSLRPIDVSAVEVLNLKQFLRNTGQFDLPPEERLRQLAIFLEPQTGSPQPRAWLAIDRIFRYAIRLAPDSLWLHHSRSVSAKYAAEGLDCGKTVTSRRLLDVAWEAGKRAYSFVPGEPDVLYLLGGLSYVDPTRSLDDSLRYFAAALEIDSQHQWSRLYVAHCLQDLQRWGPAANAYRDVDPAIFVGPNAWRYELLLEQKAYCTFRSGAQTTALTEFQSLLDRWLADPRLCLGIPRPHLAEIANATFQGQLIARYNELLKAESRLMRKYPESPHGDEIYQ